MNFFFKKMKWKYSISNQYLMWKKKRGFKSNLDFQSKSSRVRTKWTSSSYKLQKKIWMHLRSSLSKRRSRVVMHYRISRRKWNKWFRIKLRFCKCRRCRSRRNWRIRLLNSRRLFSYIRAVTLKYLTSSQLGMNPRTRTSCWLTSSTIIESTSI
jgi:hypothetical protein